MLNNSNCRVCGYALGFAPWGENNSDPTWEICPCCGTEFGYEDSTIAGVQQARQRWIEGGARWFDNKAKPANWDINLQLKNMHWGELDVKMDSKNVEISTDSAFMRDGENAVLIKYSHPIFEANIFIPTGMIEQLITFLQSNLEYVKIGTSCSNDIYWSREGEDVYILVGADREAWDICLVLTPDLISKTIAGIKMSGLY